MFFIFWAEGKVGGGTLKGGLLGKCSKKSFKIGFNLDSKSNFSFIPNGRLISRKKSF